jgi:hypothetical protein
VKAVFRAEVLKEEVEGVDLNAARAKLRVVEAIIKELSISISVAGWETDKMAWGKLEKKDPQLEDVLKDGGRQWKWKSGIEWKLYVNERATEWRLFLGLAYFSRDLAKYPGWTVDCEPARNGPTISSLIMNNQPINMWGNTITLTNLTILTILDFEILTNSLSSSVTISGPSQGWEFYS